MEQLTLAVLAMMGIPSQPAYWPMVLTPIQMLLRIHQKVCFLYLPLLVLETWLLSFHVWLLPLSPSPCFSDQFRLLFSFSDLGSMVYSVLPSFIMLASPRAAGASYSFHSSLELLCLSWKERMLCSFSSTCAGSISANISKYQGHSKKTRSFQMEEQLHKHTIISVLFFQGNSDMTLSVLILRRYWPCTCVSTLPGILRKREIMGRQESEAQAYTEPSG